VSRHGRRRPRSRHSHPSQQKPQFSHVRPFTAEPDEIREASHPTAAGLTSDECLDDRPPANEVPAPPPGLALQQQREASGLTIDDVARTTKISKTILRALEASDVLHLPAPIYTRGFVKAYAQEVGLPPDETADTYLRAIEPHHDDQVLEVGAAVPVMPPPQAAGGHDAARDLSAFSLRHVGRIALVAGAVGLLVYFASSRRDDTPARAPAGVEELSDAARAGGIDAEDPTRPDATPAALTDTPLRVELAPQGPCWVSVRVGGETVLAKLLKAGDRETIHLTDEAVVRVGEPGALLYSINGKSGRALGPAGTPVTVRISKDNFRDFLSS
jgi:transcriptional regulator with XRE-family HTH domain